MNEDQRAVIEKAFAVLDSVDAMKAEPKPALTFEQQAALDDAWLADLQRKRLEREPLVYRTTITPQPKTESGMTDSDRQWVMHQLEALADLIGEETGKNESKVAKVLREEIAGLRSEIESLKKTGKPDVSLKGVVPLQRSRAS